MAEAKENNFLSFFQVKINFRLIDFFGLNCLLKKPLYTVKVYNGFFVYSKNPDLVYDGNMCVWHNGFVGFLCYNNIFFVLF